MPSESSSLDQENPFFRESLIESSTTFQHGNPLENDTNPEVSLEQKRFSKDVLENSEKLGDVKVFKTSTGSNNNGEQDRLPQVNGDVARESHEQQSYRELYDSPIRSISESALERPIGISALSKCSAIEKLPNGNIYDSIGL